MLIYMVRHGETNLNAQRTMQGWLDEPLNQAGRDLAALTGKAMKGIHFDACISSPLKRAKETVEIILRESGNDVEITTDDRIKEINFGDYEKKNMLELGEDGRLFATNPFLFDRFPNGEDGRARLIADDKIYYPKEFIVDRYKTCPPTRRNNGGRRLRRR